ncbi:hypothetical protein CIPAW_15G069700 [Carya illinoinensis]|uniref:Uncharacterized protein n=1 Tax=Carya illinoinensis TaxID=32201 RepID=A0A8T1NA28_CARIL|nr:hypothetical protein CIPAW_15G069700 [Carya illinoinensis]
MIGFAIQYFDIFCRIVSHAFYMEDFGDCCSQRESMIFWNFFLSPFHGEVFLLV